jgi:hypothetical protein
MILWTPALMLLGIVYAIVNGAPVGAMLKQPIILYILVDTLAFSALAAYGLATIFGKSLEA